MPIWEDMMRWSRWNRLFLMFHPPSQRQLTCAGKTFLVRRAFHNMNLLKV